MPGPSYVRAARTKRFGSTLHKTRKLSIESLEARQVMSAAPLIFAQQPSDIRVTLDTQTGNQAQYTAALAAAQPQSAISADVVLQQLVDLRLVTPTTVEGLLDTVSFDQVYRSMNAEQLVASLVANNLVGQVTDAASLRTVLASTRNIDLDHLRPDGILTALATMNGGSYLRVGSTVLDAPQAKALLQSAFAADKVEFLNYFSVEELVYLLDDSIRSANGAEYDPIYVLADRTIAEGLGNEIVVGHQTWIPDHSDPSTFPKPEAAFRATSAMPEGYRTIFIYRFLEIHGFGSSEGNTHGYIDPVDSNGQPSQHYLLWMDEWELQARDRLRNFLSEYKALGGELDFVLLDTEDTMLTYNSMRTFDRRVDPSKPVTMTVWEELLADPRWPALKAELMDRGIPAEDLTLDKISTWRLDSINAVHWDAVMYKRRAEYLNAAITDTVLELYPHAKISNYDDVYRSQTIVASNSYHSMGQIVGNAQSRNIYGHKFDASTSAGISQPVNQFRSHISSVSFVQDRNPNGVPLPSGTATVTFFEPPNGVNVGEEIHVLNRGEVNWIDPRYTGYHTIESISADGLSITYSVALPNNSAPRAQDLSPRGNSVVLTAYVDFLRSYERLVSQVKRLRDQTAASDLTLLPYISNPDWTNRGTYNHYGEGVFHAALSGAKSLLWWKSGWDPQPENTRIVQALLDELNPLIGYSDRQTLSFDDPGWDIGYVMTGMEAGGQRVYRFTPDPIVPMSILSSSGTVRIQVGSKIVEVPNASIYTPAETVSSLGVWIIQTEGSTSLVDTPERVLAHLRQTPGVQVSGAPAVLLGSQLRLSITTDPSLVPPGTRLSFGIDWNGDGKVNQTYSGTGGLNVSALYSSAGTRNVTIYTTVVETGLQLLPVSFQAQVLRSGFTVERSKDDISVRNLIFAGTDDSDNVVFHSAGPGVVEAHVTANGRISRHVFENITGALYAYGFGGNDIFNASTVDLPVYFYGGDGNDVLIGGVRSNHLYGGNGDDFIFAGPGLNVIDAGSGNNRIKTSLGFSWIAEGANNTMLGAAARHLTVSASAIPQMAQVIAAATHPSVATQPRQLASMAVQAGGLPTSDLARASALPQSTGVPSIDTLVDAGWGDPLADTRLDDM